MKNYDDGVKLQLLDMPLESEYKNEILTDDEIIERRWKKTDRALKKAYPFIVKAYRQIGDDLIDMLKDIDFTYEKLNKTVSPKVRRYVEDRIEFWSDSGLLTGFLGYLVSTHTWTYKSVLKMLICGIYANRFKRIKKVSNDVFKVASVDAYAQSITDRRINDFVLLTLPVILSFAVMPVMGTTYIEYLDGVIMSQVEQAESFLLVSLQQNVEISENALKVVITKQIHRILKIKNGKYSGGLDDATRNVSNQAYTYEPKNNNQQVRFIAHIDERTTEMCRSLNGQIFNTVDENVFKRYSANSGRVVEVRCKGLVQGLNMPPIQDHFHWCRSTLTYQI